VDTTLVQRQAPPVSRARGAGHHQSWWIVALVVTLTTFGAASCGDGDKTTDRAAIATELVETFNRGWNENNAEAVGSVFTADGTYINDVPGMAGGGTWTRDETMADVERRGHLITEAHRVGELTPTDHGTFTWVEEFTTSGDGQLYSGVLAIQLDGDLASRIEWLSLETLDS